MLAIVAHRMTWTTAGLVAAGWPASIAVRRSPEEAVARLGPGDVALARLDVRETVDGVEPGCDRLLELVARGVVLLNPAAGLLRAHDKLMTASVLGAVGLPHPVTALYVAGAAMPEFTGAVVVKPRFGSWGRDVVRCRDRSELELTLTAVARRPWFARTGALVQKLVPPSRSDLRILVAGGRVVGAVERIAQRGEWRTNVALGARRRPVDPPPDACALALRAAAACALDLVGVDLLPADDGWVVIELNAAADFTREYAQGDVFAATRDALAAVVRGHEERGATIALAPA
jgi:RimK family alpha-L-glutamate ligase